MKITCILAGVLTLALIEGLDVVRAIQALPARGQRLSPSVKISSVRRMDARHNNYSHHQGGTV